MADRTGSISAYKEYHVFEWRVQDFSTLDEMDGACYFSPDFSFGGERWCLVIYPNGASYRGTSGHVDLWLRKCPSGRSIRVSVSLSLKTAKGERHKEEHVTKDFDDSFLNCLHRFNRFVSRAELTRLRSDLLPDDVLTVVCTMKGRSSDGSEKGEASNAGVNKSDVVGASGSRQAGTTATKESEGEASNAEVNKSDVAEASGSRQAGTTTTKEAVLKWIEENCKVASKGKKRKTEAENILKWIEQNYHETSDAKKRKMEGEICNPGSAENCSSDSDSGESSSDSDSDKSSSDSESVECCHKCPKCLAIVKKQKKLWEKLGSQKETSQCAQSLREGYKRMLLDGRHHDLILKVGDKELRAHRDVLRARSRVFESMLDHDMKEGNTGVIDVPDCDPDAMQLFLSYVYCGKIEGVDHSNMLGLYYIADKYEMTELKSECSNFIKKSLSHTNICSVIQLALNHSDSELLDYATEYFSDHMIDIMKTVEWQTFLKNNLTAGNELIIKSLELKNAQS